MVVQDEKDPTSSCFIMITRQDIKMPVVPFWLINQVFPAELRKWMQSCRSACQKDVQKLGPAGLIKPVLPKLFPRQVGDTLDEGDVASESDCQWEEEKASQVAPLSLNTEAKVLDDVDIASSVDNTQGPAANGCSFQLEFVYDEPETQLEGPRMQSPTAAVHHRWLCGCDCRPW